MRGEEEHCEQKIIIRKYITDTTSLQLLFADSIESSV